MRASALGVIVLGLLMLGLVGCEGYGTILPTSTAIPPPVGPTWSPEKAITVVANAVKEPEYGRLVSRGAKATYVYRTPEGYLTSEGVWEVVFVARGAVWRVSERDSIVVPMTAGAKNMQYYQK